MHDCVLLNVSCSSFAFSSTYTIHTHTFYSQPKNTSTNSMQSEQLIQCSLDTINFPSLASTFNSRHMAILLLLLLFVICLKIRLLTRELWTIHTVSAWEYFHLRDDNSLHLKHHKLIQYLLRSCAIFMHRSTAITLYDSHLIPQLSWNPFKLLDVFGVQYLWLKQNYGRKPA